MRVAAHAVPLLVSFRRDFRRWIWWGAGLSRSTAFHARRARRLVRSAGTLGPAFVKMAQIFAARADLVPEPYLSELATLTDRVPPVPWPAIHEALTAAYGTAPEHVFETLDATPLAAGSLGQVHRARVHGRDVVVKVLRPGVEVTVRRDGEIAAWIADRVFERFPNRHVDGVRVVLREFRRCVEEEMDFRLEAAQCSRMRERFLDDARIRIPAVESGLTRQRALVLEYLEGTRVDALHARVADGSVNPAYLAETLIETYARMMLRDGVFHADPHPGNLLVAPDGVIVLLDFGMVINVDPLVRRALFDTVLAAIRRSVPATVAGFRSLGLVVDGTSDSTLEQLVSNLLVIAYDEGTSAERAQVLADRVMAELHDWPIILPGELVYFARTAALIEGVGATYDPSFNSIAVASPVVLRMRREILGTLFGAAPGEERVVAVARGLGALAGTAVSWLRSQRNAPLTDVLSAIRDGASTVLADAPKRP